MLPSISRNSNDADVIYVRAHNVHDYIPATKTTNNMIYLDNNATTVMSKETMAAMVNWCNRGNASAGYASAKESRAMMEEFRQYLGKLCRFKPCCIEKRDEDNTNSANGANAKCTTTATYAVIFTSGASEANCTVFGGLLDAYMRDNGAVPHVVMSAIEHKSLITMAESYEERGLATVTYVQPTRSGHIRPEDVAAAITDATCGVFVMHANNETGANNDIHAIGELSAHAGIPFHSDTVQSFGKYPPNLSVDHIDSFCISAHKFGGPPGTGVLVIRRDLLENMSPLIYGTQNGGHRGGTENLPGIGAALHAMKTAMLNRAEANARMFALKKYIMGRDGLGGVGTMQYTKYTGNVYDKHITICFLSGCTQYYLPNTILLSVVKQTEPYICNTKIKEYLEAHGIVISVGSACNTASAKASHVLYAMGADMYIRKGALRISLGDLTTLDDVKTFVKVFNAAVLAQVDPVSKRSS